MQCMMDLPCVVNASVLGLCILNCGEYWTT